MTSAYVCDKCGERLVKDQLLEETDPDLYQHPLREACEEARNERKEPPLPVRLYHKQHAYRQYGGTSHFFLCGPVNPETTQEYFVHWIGSSMRHPNQH